MCNFVLRNKKSMFRKIAPSGTGWKIFFKEKSGRLVAAVRLVPYVRDVKGQIVWDTAYAAAGDGFCFFKEQKSAKHGVALILGVWNWPAHTEGELVVRKINYKQGVGTFYTDDYSWSKVRWFKTARFAICKEFNIELESGEYI